MTELLKTKTKVRGGHRAHTSKLIAECKVALDNYEPSLQTKIKHGRPLYKKRRQP